ncbi:MAG: hypothetical protein ACC661_01305, partial [Verrucomicrobiales bacterium]
LKGEKLDTSEAVVDYLARAIFSVEISDADREKLVAYLENRGPLPPSDQWKALPAESVKKRKMKKDAGVETSRRLLELLVLMMSMPEYQVT